MLPRPGALSLCPRENSAGNSDTTRPHASSPSVHEAFLFHAQQETPVTVPFLLVRGDSKGEPDGPDDSRFYAVQGSHTEVVSKISRVILREPRLRRGKLRDRRISLIESDSPQGMPSAFDPINSIGSQNDISRTYRTTSFGVRIRTLASSHPFLLPGERQGRREVAKMTIKP